MADDKDPLDNKVSVAAKMDETGLSASAKSRWISAIDRFFGNFFDLANPWMESKTRISRAKTDAIVEVIKSIGTAAADQCEQNPELARKLAQSIASEHFHKLGNREDIAFKAIEHLTEDPKKFAGEAKAEDVSDDWINTFTSFAERASSEPLQNLWARVLAGEIAKPKSFSMTTLRMISELDSETAKLFEKHASRVFGHASFLMYKGENLSGELLIELTKLEQAGFISGVNGTSSVNVKADEEGKAGLPIGPVALAGKAKPGLKISVAVAHMTLSGIELLQILPATNAIQTADLVAAQLQKHVSELTLFAMVDGKTTAIKKYN